MPEVQADLFDVEPCYVCGGPSEYLCDGIISISVTGISLDDADSWRTCDKPMCRQHTAEHDPAFYCSHGLEDESGRCEMDSWDYCDQCLTRRNMTSRRPLYKRHVSNNHPLAPQLAGRTRNRGDRR